MKYEKEKFLSLVQQSREGAISAFRQMFGRGVPYNQDAIEDHFKRDKNLWRIDETGRFRYTGSNPEGTSRYRMSILSEQLVAYEYSVTYGFFSEPAYQNLVEFATAQGPDYILQTLPKIVSVFELDSAFEQQRDHQQERDVHENFRDMHNYLGKSPYGYVCYRDKFFSGDWNDNKDNIVAVPLFVAADCAKVLAFLSLREPDAHPRPMWIDDIGNTCYLTEKGERRGYEFGFVRTDFNISLIPSFWSHAHKIKSVHVNRETGKLETDA